MLSGDIYHYREERTLNRVPVQSRADARVESGNRCVSENVGGAALDSARLHCQRQAKERARLIRLIDVLGRTMLPEGEKCKPLEI